MGKFIIACFAGLGAGGCAGGASGNSNVGLVTAVIVFICAMSL